MKLKLYLQQHLPEKIHPYLSNAFDTVGDILIFNKITEELIPYEKKIGKLTLQHLKHINVVCKKAGKYQGTYRTPVLRILAGKRRKETIHKENGVRLKLHAQNTYFSTRTATERLRVANLIKKGESILVMFSGIAPFPLVIEKHSDAKEIVGVEINPHAHKYAMENLTLNKSKTITLYNEDVRKQLPKIKQTFDRIIMPLPKMAIDFLDVALTKSHKGTTIHLYAFVIEDEIDAFKKRIKEICKESKKKCRIQNIEKCGQYAPKEFRLSFDIKIL